MIEITEIRLLLREHAQLKAFVSVTINHGLVIHGMKVIHGTNGLFVAMPSKKGPDGLHRDTVHPLNPAVREYITQVVMAEYRAQRNGATQ